MLNISILFLPGLLCTPEIFSHQIRAVSICRYPPLHTGLDTVQETMKRMADAYGMDTFRQHAAALASKIDYIPFLPQEETPLLIIHGAEDSICG